MKKIIGLLMFIAMTSYGVIGIVEGDIAIVPSDSTKANVSSITLQNVINTGKTATNANMSIGSTNETISKVYISGEAGAYTNKPLMVLDRSATGTGKIQSWRVNGVEVRAVELDGSASSTAVAGGTNYVFTEYWDATNNVKRFTKTP